MKELLDFTGLTAVAKLIESRLERDIAATEARLRAEEAREPSTSQGLVAKVGERLKENARESLRKEIVEKRRWRDTWRKIVWAGLAEAGADVGDLQR
jgi:hypothetical protein